jgi:hypothetical protein
MQFKYSFKEINRDKIPMLEIRVTNKDNRKATNYLAMLDSGSFSNIFHSDVAEVLDIDLSKIKEIQFGGVKKAKQMRGKPYIVELMVIGKRESYKFDSYVIFSDEISNTGHPLLGRIGFFDQFDEVCFNYKTNKFYLRKS